jgi:hypothetical protein
MSRLNISTISAIANARFADVIGVMARRKQTISFSIDPTLADRFRDATKEYYGKLGLCFSAGMLMFLESDPPTQAKYIKAIFDAELAKEVGLLLDTARAEQLKKIKSREESGKTKRS